MEILAIVLFVVTSSGVYGLDGLLRAKRQEPGTIPESFLQPFRKKLGLPDFPEEPIINEKYQECRYKRRQGFCRHVEFCPFPEYIERNETFLRHSCVINGTHVGVCCPNFYYNKLPEVSPTLPPFDVDPRNGTGSGFGEAAEIPSSFNETEEIPAFFVQRLMRDLKLSNPPELPSIDEKFHSCVFHKKQGFCRHLQFCPLPEFSSNYSALKRHACIINETYLGVCCPTFYHNRLNMPPLDVDIEGNETNSTGAECGISFRRRIVKRTNADPKDWTWMAALLVRSEQYCGGVLINDQYVLTAAICVDKFRSNPGAVKVRIGEYNFRDTSESNHQDYDIAKIKIHPSYSSESPTPVNNIALLKLASRVPLGNPTQPICLPSANDKYCNVDARAAGWGALPTGDPPSPILQETTIPIWPQDRCRSTYAQIRQISSAELCAGTYSGDEDSCQGDSGGPLMVENSSKRWTVVGVVSWGMRCSLKGFPVVYTRVSKFIDWIRANSGS